MLHKDNTVNSAIQEGLRQIVAQCPSGGKHGHEVSGYIMEAMRAWPCNPEVNSMGVVMYFVMTMEAACERAEAARLPAQIVRMGFHFHIRPELEKLDGVEQAFKDLLV